MSETLSQIIAKMGTPAKPTGSTPKVPKEPKVPKVVQKARQTAVKRSPNPFVQAVEQAFKPTTPTKPQEPNLGQIIKQFKDVASSGRKQRGETLMQEYIRNTQPVSGNMGFKAGSGKGATIEAEMAAYDRKTFGAETYGKRPKGVSTAEWSKRQSHKGKFKQLAGTRNEQVAELDREIEAYKLENMTPVQRLELARETSGGLPGFYDKERASALAASLMGSQDLKDKTDASLFIRAANQVMQPVSTAYTVAMKDPRSLAEMPVGLQVGLSAGDLGAQIVGGFLTGGGSTPATASTLARIGAVATRSLALDAPGYIQMIEDAGGVDKALVAYKDMIGKALDPNSKISASERVNGIALAGMIVLSGGGKIAGKIKGGKPTHDLPTKPLDVEAPPARTDLDPVADAYSKWQGMDGEEVPNAKAATKTIKPKPEAVPPSVESVRGEVGSVGLDAQPKVRGRKTEQATGSDVKPEAGRVGAGAEAPKPSAFQQLHPQQMSKAGDGWIIRKWSGTTWLPKKQAEIYHQQTINDFGAENTRLVQDSTNPKLWAVELNPNWKDATPNSPKIAGQAETLPPPTPKPTGNPSRGAGRAAGAKVADQPAPEPKPETVDAGLYAPLRPGKGREMASYQIRLKDGSSSQRDGERLQNGLFGGIDEKGGAYVVTDGATGRTVLWRRNRSEAIKALKSVTPEELSAWRAKLPKSAPEPVKAEVEPKEAWEMTREEYAGQQDKMRMSPYDEFAGHKTPSWRTEDLNKGFAYHKWGVVEQALKEGKPVPAEVLADYPDLAAKYAKPSVPGIPDNSAKAKEPWEMTREEFSGKQDTFSHAQPNPDWATNAEATGLRLTDTLRKHHRSDNETAIGDVPKSAWVLRGIDNPYGKHLALFGSADAKILVEGTREFVQIAKGLKSSAVRMQTAAPDIVARAKAAGYDAVEFKGTNIGTVVINGEKFISHRTAVQKALSEGKPVPASVLADYPDLQAKAPKTPPKEPVAATPKKADPLESLKQEARKYKSAEEFVKNNFVAHGTNKEILGNLQPTNGWYGKAVYTTDDLANASGRNGGGVTYFVNKPQGKLLEINAHGSKGGSGFTPQQYQDAIKNGYDGLKIKHDDGKTWYAMFNEQTPHTKQQLTDLYNQSKPSIKDKVKNSLKSLNYAAAKEAWELGQSEYIAKKVDDDFPPDNTDWDAVRRIEAEMKPLFDRSRDLAWVMKPIGKKGQYAVPANLKGAKLKEYNEVQAKLNKLDIERDKLTGGTYRKYYSARHAASRSKSDVEINEALDIAESIKGKEAVQEIYSQATRNPNASESTKARAQKLLDDHEKGESDWVRGHEQSHRSAVQKALSEGKPVPPEVLADYPDLKPKADVPPVKPPKVEVEKPPVKPPVVKPPKVNEPVKAGKGGEEPKNATGLARQFTDPERFARELEETRAPAQSVQKLVDATQAEWGDGGHIKAELALRRGNEPGFNPTRDQIVKDTAMVAHLKREVKNEYDRLLRKDDPTPQDMADIQAVEAKLNEIDEYAQKIRTHWHDVGMALQIAYKPDFTVADLTMRARAANGGDISPDAQKQINDWVSKYEAAQKELEELRKAKPPKEVSGVAVSRPKLARATAFNRLANLGLEVRGEDGALVAPTKGGGMKGGKQAGAVAIPKLTPSMENELRKSIRQIAKAYIVDEHPIAGSLDGVVTLVRKHLPSLSEEDIWRYLSDRYHRVLLDSDLQRRESQAFMRRIQAAADYRNKTLLEKGFAQAGALLNTTQRGLQASMDLSAPFRQGRRVMVTKEWVNAWLPSTKAMFAKDPQKAMELHSAELARSPYYSKGVESGLGISSASKPEEVWAGRLLQDWAAGKGLAAGKANPLRAYANLIQRSEAHYTIFLNDLRMRLFENLAKRNPNDKEYLESIAQMINVMTGRGHGKTATMLSHPAAGNVFYAPRYAWSEVQSTGMVPIWKTKSKMARQEAIKAYGRNFAVTVVGLSLARLFGNEVELDPRGTDFLKVRLQNGKVVDVLGASQQYLRLLVRMGYGSTSRKGFYSEPGAFGADPLMQAVNNKLSPAARSLLGLLRGWASPNADGDWQKQPPGMVLRDSVTPMGARKTGDQMWSDGDKWALLNLLGIDYEKGQPNKRQKKGSRPPKLEGLPQGMRQFAGHAPITGR